MEIPASEVRAGMTVSHPATGPFIVYNVGSVPATGGVRLMTRSGSYHYFRPDTPLEAKWITCGACGGKGVNPLTGQECRACRGQGGWED